MIIVRLRAVDRNVAKDDSNEMHRLVLLLGVVALNWSCAAAPEPSWLSQVRYVPPPPAPPGRDEADIEPIWTGEEEFLHDDPGWTNNTLVPNTRLVAPEALGKRVREGRFAAVSCRRLGKAPVWVRFQPLSEKPADAWAAVDAAWSPRQNREFPGPGWERGCGPNEEGVLLDRGWVREEWRVPQLEAAFPGARPWINGFRVYLPGRAWIDAFQEVEAALVTFEANPAAAMEALLLDGSCRAALIGAEWLSRAGPGATVVRTQVANAVAARLNAGVVDGARGLLLRVLADLYAKPSVPFNAMDQAWRGTPLFVLPANVGVDSGQLGCRVTGLVLEKPVDPLRWADACDAR